MYKSFINNFWLKIISLILAIVAWFYISGELSERQTVYYPRPPVMANP